MPSSWEWLRWGKGGEKPCKIHYSFGTTEPHGIWDIVALIGANGSLLHKRCLWVDGLSGCGSLPGVCTDQNPTRLVQGCEEGSRRCPGWATAVPHCCSDPLGLRISSHVFCLLCWGLPRCSLVRCVPRFVSCVSWLLQCFSYWNSFAFQPIVVQMYCKHKHNFSIQDNDLIVECY